MNQKRNFTLASLAALILAGLCPLAASGDGQAMPGLAPAPALAPSSGPAPTAVPVPAEVASALETFIRDLFQLEGLREELAELQQYHLQKVGKAQRPHSWRTLQADINYAQREVFDTFEAAYAQREDRNPLLPWLHEGYATEMEFSYEDSGQYRVCMEVSWPTIKVPPVIIHSPGLVAPDPAVPAPAAADAGPAKDKKDEKKV